MDTYISYLRLSTQKQGKSGLGLEAQRSIVQNYIKQGSKCLLAEFLEIESGKVNNRPELMRAISKTKETGSTLIVAKLDRLSRSVKFVSSLMESKVKFICCDLPQANNLTIHIFSAMAEFERSRISERITEALKIKRVREPNWKPGTPANLNDELRKKGYTTISNNARTDQSVKYAYYFIKPLRESGKTYQQIADLLNRENFKTRTGKKYRSKQVWDICKRFHICEEFTPRQKESC